MSWFIDSWDARGGLAFISERDENSLDAEQTVFVAVPDFSIEPVAKISTALWATRGSFQDRFYTLDENGEPREHAFESLDAAIELVRRAYVGGGSSPEPDEEEPEPEPPPEGPPEDEGDWLPEDWGHLREALVNNRPGEAQAELASLCTRLAASSTHAGTVRFALDTAARLLARSRHDSDPSALEPGIMWVAGLDRAGLVPPDGWRWLARHTAEPWDDLLIEIFERHMSMHPWRWSPWWGPWRVSGLRRALLRGLFWEVPMRAPTGELTSLGRYLALLARSRQPLSTLSSANAIAPALVAGLVVSAAALEGDSLHWLMATASAKRRAAVRRQAGRWVAELLPSAGLDDDSVEHSMTVWAKTTSRVKVGGV